MFVGQKVSAEFKESILKKVIARGAKSLSEIAREQGIGSSTLYEWVKKADLKKNDTIPSRAEQFRHLMAVAKLNETEIGAYCRQHGLYSMHLKEWENEFMKQYMPDLKYKAENVALRKKNADLERS